MCFSLVCSSFFMLIKIKIKLSLIQSLTRSVSWNTGAISPSHFDNIPSYIHTTLCGASTESKQKHQNQTKPRFMHEFEILMCNLRGIFFLESAFRIGKYILAPGGHANAAAGNFWFNFV